MKIKTVCELTGLTDRTILYYIEEKLIFPLYTENYLGRKTYNFSENDSKDLNDIAVLRKFDFTLEEIKSVINDAETSKEILSNVKDRTAQTVLHGQNKLSVLSKISTEKAMRLVDFSVPLDLQTFIFNFSNLSPQMAGNSCFPHGLCHVSEPCRRFSGS